MKISKRSGKGRKSGTHQKHIGNAFKFKGKRQGDLISSMPGGSVLLETMLGALRLQKNEK